MRALNKLFPIKHTHTIDQYAKFQPLKAKTEAAKGFAKCLFSDQPTKQPINPTTDQPTVYKTLSPPKTQDCDLTAQTDG